MVLQLELPTLGARLVPAEHKVLQENIGGALAAAQARRSRSGVYGGLGGGGGRGEATIVAWGQGGRRIGPCSSQEHVLGWGRKRRVLSCCLSLPFRHWRRATASTLPSPHCMGHAPGAGMGGSP
jgi:hypothetical protein